MGRNKLKILVTQEKSKTSILKSCSSHFLDKKIFFRIQWSKNPRIKSFVSNKRKSTYFNKHWMIKCKNAQRR